MSPSLLPFVEFRRIYGRKSSEVKREGMENLGPQVLELRQAKSKDHLQDDKE